MYNCNWLSFCLPCCTTKVAPFQKESNKYAPNLGGFHESINEEEPATDRHEIDNLLKIRITQQQIASTQQTIHIAMQQLTGSVVSDDSDSEPSSIVSSNSQIRLLVTRESSRSSIEQVSPPANSRAINVTKIESLSEKSLTPKARERRNLADWLKERQTVEMDEFKNGYSS